MLLMAVILAAILFSLLGFTFADFREGIKDGYALPMDWLLSFQKYRNDDDFRIELQNICKHSSRLINALLIARCVGGVLLSILFLLVMIAVFLIAVAVLVLLLGFLDFLFSR